MEKKILVYSYWLGMLCMVVAMVWRAANALGFWVSSMTGRIPVNYMSFYKGALLFLLVAVATNAYQSGNRS